jgi:photosystem II stability/assembly factor-like uncharacterized protein
MVVALLLVAGLGFAASGQWIGVGPFGGTVTSLATFPDQPLKVLAGTMHGLYLSDDAGASWCRTGQINFEVDNLVVASSDPQVVYGTGFTYLSWGWASVLLHSTDGGATWVERLTPAMPSSSSHYPLYALGVHPLQPAVVVAGTAGGILRSADSGATWEYVVGSRSVGVKAIVFHPTQPDTVFAGVVDRNSDSPWGGVIKSTDGGKTWSPSREGLRRTYLGSKEMWAPVMGLTIVPGTPDTIFGVVGQEFWSTTYAEVVRSTDGGAQWTSVLSFDYAPSNYGWNTLSLALDPTDPRTILVGSFSYGLRRSTDGGATWEDASGGLRCAGASDDPYNHDVKPVQEVYTVALLPGNGPRALIGTDREGVWLSDDLGGSWRQSNQGLAAMTVKALLADESMPGTVLVGTEEAGVQRSDDGGQTWTPANTGLYDGCAPYRGEPGGSDCPESSVRRLVTLPGAAGLGAGQCTSFYQSSDGGTSWSASPGSPWSQAFALDPRDPQVMLSAAELFWNESRVKRSVDGGQTWTWCGAFPVEEGYSTSVHDLLFDPTSSLVVYAATYNGLFMSVDSCASWSPRSSGLVLSCGPVTRVLAQTVAPYRMVAAMGCGLFLSTTGGRNWSPVGPAGESISDLIADPDHPSVFYAGTATKGVLQSTDGGLTWTPLGRGLPSGVASLLLSPSGRQLLAGTAGGSVWLLDLPTTPRRVLRRSGQGAPPALAVEATPLD